MLFTLLVLLHHRIQRTLLLFVLVLFLLVTVLTLLGDLNVEQTVVTLLVVFLVYISCSCGLLVLADFIIFALNIGVVIAVVAGSSVGVFCGLVVVGVALEVKLRSTRDDLSPVSCRHTL